MIEATTVDRHLEAELRKELLLLLKHCVAATARGTNTLKAIGLSAYRLRNIKESPFSVKLSELRELVVVCDSSSLWNASDTPDLYPIVLHFLSSGREPQTCRCHDG